jgi:hypothetical protein
MPIDRIGSMVNLAKAQKQALDSSAMTTEVSTATYILLLDTLIELGEQPHAAKLDDSAKRTVMGMTAQFGDQR